MSSWLEKPQFSREHRLGLVVYGGIALAIYMNGICQEFYNAVRGRGIYKLIKALTDADIVVDIISGTSAGGINGVLLSYALANSKKEEPSNNPDKKLSRYEIKFEEFAKVWKESGDIQKLLFENEYDGVEKSSFFDGVGYYKPKIEQALKERKHDLDEKAPEEDWFSEFGELDLFVTGTDLLGRFYQVFDNTGCVIDVKDHHAIFHLKYREQGDNSFDIEDNTTCKALAKLCQITSCFPVAFPPVTVKLEPTNSEADKKLIEWGNLKKNRILSEVKPKEDTSRSIDKRLQEIDDDPGEGYRLHFVDGGVLDNRPFSYTIKEIYHRTAERPVFRKLFYVDPSPDRFQGNDNYNKMQKPDIGQVVRDALIGMPRYESINNDLELIKEHNEKVLRYKFLLVDLENLLDKEIPDPENQDFYDQQRNVYLRTRLINLEDKILPLIFLELEDFQDTNIQGKDRTKLLDKVAKLLAKPFTDPQENAKRLELLERLKEDIRYLDVDYALRTYFFIAEYVYRLLDKDDLYKWLKNKNKIDHLYISEENLNNLINNQLRPLIKEFNYNIKRIEAIKEKLEKLFTSREIQRFFFDLAKTIADDSSNASLAEDFPKKFYRGMLWLHGTFLNIEKSSLDSNIDQLAEKLQRNLKHLKKSTHELDNFLNKFSEEQQLSVLKELADKSILKELLNSSEKKILKEFEANILFGNEIQNKLLKYFRNFEKLDTVLYPLDYLAGIPEKQLIETYRISPEDAKFGFSKNIEEGKRLDYKLAGDSLKAFGGFLKKSWRANDILWGRLDGLNRIVEALVTEEKIKNFSNFLQRQAKTGEESQYLDKLLDEALSLNSFQEQGRQVDVEKLKHHKTKLKNHIEELITVFSNEDEIEQSCSKKLIQELVELIVDVGHFIILDQEFKNTMEVLIEEQLNWGKLKILQPKNQNQSEIPKFIPIKGSFHPTITALAVTELAKQSLASLSLQEKENIFKNYYKIGSENWKDIPIAELRKIILRFVRIFRDILITWQRTTRKRKIWKSKPLSISSKFWNRLGLIVIRFIIIVGIFVLELFVRFFLWILSLSDAPKR